MALVGAVVDRRDGADQDWLAISAIDICIDFPLASPAARIEVPGTVPPADPVLPTTTR